MQPTYRLRFFFDWSSGTCFWAGNDAARESFDYPVDPTALPLSPDTIAEIERLADWFDTALNWDYPPDPGPWRQEECDRFNRAAQDLLDASRRELGPDFEIVNEFHDLAADPDLDEYLKDPKGFRRQD